MKVRTAVFLVPLALLIVAVLVGSALVMRLFFLSVLVPIVSYAWTVVGVRGVDVSTGSPPDHCQVGDRFEQDITVANRSRLPKLWLGVEEGTDMPGQHDSTVVTLPGGGQHQWRSSHQCSRRGVYSLGTVIATASDPFGLFARRRVLGEPHEVLVYPATLDLPLFKASSLNDFGYGSGYQSISQLSPNASSVREFSSGDSLNHIHWGSTAHTGKLMVKMFDADRSATGSKIVWIVLDMEAAPQAGEGEESTEEYGVTIAASLARKHAETGMQVGLLAQGDEACFASPQRGEEHLWRILKSLALMRATGRTPVGRLVSDQMERLRGNSIVIIITPSASGELYDACRQLRNRVDSVVTILIDPASFGADTSAMSISRNLSATGVQVYVVQRGDEMARALDHRTSLLHARYV
jgi:uncharacterized protein (DUF58 family)